MSRTSVDGVDVPPVDDLAGIYSAQLESFAELVDGLTNDQWAMPSPCPGWTVADVVAHVIALELELHGEPLPEHEPDWENLPHVRSPVDRYIEMPVDYRRGCTPDELSAELRETVEWRREDLAGLTTAPREIVSGPGGWQLEQQALLRNRIFDLWVHGLDIVLAIDGEWPLDPYPAAVSTRLMLDAMPKVWAKKVGAPIGARLALRITGSPIPAETSIVVDPDGRGRFVESPAAGEAAAGVTMDWRSFILRATGRLAGQEMDDGQLTGDQNLAQAFVDSMTVTF